MSVCVRSFAALKFEADVQLPQVLCRAAGVMMMRASCIACFRIWISCCFAHRIQPANAARFPPRRAVSPHGSLGNFVRTFAVRCFIYPGSLLHRPPASCCGSRHVAQVAKHHSPAACRSPLDRPWNHIFIHDKLLCTAESDRVTVKTRESSADRGLRCIPWIHVEAKLAS